MDLLLFITIVLGLVEPVRSPVQWSKCHPLAALAVHCTDVPEAYEPPGGFNAMLPEPVTLVVSV